MVAANTARDCQTDQEHRKEERARDLGEVIDTLKNVEPAQNLESMVWHTKKKLIRARSVAVMT
jgi:hypothetical protein